MNSKHLFYRNIQNKYLDEILTKEFLRTLFLKTVFFKQYFWKADKNLEFYLIRLIVCSTFFF